MVAAHGSIDVTVGGGTAPYTYAWIKDSAPFGSTSEDLLSIAAGTYTVTVTDANLCTISISKTITEPLELDQSDVTVVHLSCYNVATGSIDITLVGGTTPYTYSWSNGATTEDIANLSAGTYTVTVTDANLCPFTITREVTQPIELLTSITSKTDVKCHGDLTGAIDLSVTGGTPGSGYTYLWSNGTTTQDLSGIAAGTYTVTVRDANGCTKSETVVISEPANALSISAISSNVKCNGGSTGSIDVTVGGGTAPYTYAWIKDSAPFGSTSEDLLSIAAGTYTVTVTDANLCTISISKTITEPLELDQSDVTVVHLSCYNVATGSIDITLVGGTTPYTYSWSNGATTEDIANLSAGTYTVTVTDANLCPFTITREVTQPIEILTSITSKTDVKCHGDLTGAIDLSVTGGTPGSGYTYLWSNGTTTQDLSGIAAGTYTVTVRDANGCTKSETVVISEPANALSISAISSNVKCNGGSTGSIDVTVGGGTAPYTYAWIKDSAPFGSTSEDLLSIAAGTYTVTVTDANLCTISISKTITEPLELDQSDVTVVHLSCYNVATGSIDITLVGGTTPYTYSWSNGATTEDIANLSAGTYTVTVTDANLCPFTITREVTQPIELLTSITSKTDVKCHGDLTGAIDLSVTGGTPGSGYTYLWSNGTTTQDLSGIAAGTYTVTVRDANGCTKSETVVISEPANALSISAISSNVKCNGGSTGSIDVTVGGGTAPYTYAWIKDSAPFGSTSEDLLSIAAGTYTVTVTDANLCTISISKTITEPLELDQSDVTVVHLSCYNVATGSIDITLVGGTTPYTYSWSNGATTEDIANLSAGTYTVTVTDANLCPFTITREVTQPIEILTSITSKTDVKCHGDLTGAIDLSVTGGTPGSGYTYLWSNGTTTQDLSGIAAGTYTVTVRDANGCTKSETVVISEPANALSISAISSNVKCNGGSTGSIDVTVGGGTAPYTYAWIKDSAPFGSTSEDLLSIAAGTYTVTVTDANLCTISISKTITEPLELDQSDVTVVHLSCYNVATGSIDITLVGGTTPYTYSWSNGATTEDIANLSAGTYTVTVTDANLCPFTITREVTQPIELLTSITSKTDVKCHGDLTGAIDLSVTGGTPGSGYTYLWSNGTTTQDLSGIAAGTYTVTVRDANGCTKSETVVISEPANALSISAISSNVKCNGGSTGSIDVTVGGGTAPYTYAWIKDSAPFGSTSEDLLSIAAGTYTVTVTDANLCTISISKTITEPLEFRSIRCNCSSFILL